jgi:hypothetical protein
MSEIKSPYCACGCGEITPIAKQTRSSCGHTRGEHITFCVGHNSRLRTIPNADARTHKHEVTATQVEDGVLFNFDCEVK